MKALNALLLAGGEVLPLVEGGKGVAISTGESSGAWAAMGGIGTFSGVNADSYDADGNPIPYVYHGRNRRDRHLELIAQSIRGGIEQARIAHDLANGQGRLNLNILWEMGGAETVLRGILDGAKGLVHGVTCGAGMPYRLAEISAHYGIHYYPIVSSARAFRALWKRAYHKFSDLLGAVVYEDPWRAGGHNGLSNSEDSNVPEDPYPRVLAMRKQMREFGLGDTPIIMAGGVWCLREWENWIDNPELGPICFQFGTRPLLTKESPIPEKWKRRLLDLSDGDVVLNQFSPTGFYSSCVNNVFLHELAGRSERQVAYTVDPVGEHQIAFHIGARKREVYLTAPDKARADGWVSAGYGEALRTPDSTLVFVASEKAKEIRIDQVNCMGCLSACRFSSWSQDASGATGKKPDPRSYCIQKTLQEIAHGGDLDRELMFAGHNAFRFKTDPFYANGYIPTVRELFTRLLTGD